MTLPYRYFRMLSSPSGAGQLNPAVQFVTHCQRRPAASFTSMGVNMGFPNRLTNRWHLIRKA